MTREAIDRLLGRLERGELSREAVLEELARLPFRDLALGGAAGQGGGGAAGAVARLDTHRGLRQGWPEVVFGQGKSAAQIVAIARALLEGGGNAVVTRVAAADAARVRAELPELVWYESARVLALCSEPAAARGRGTVLVVAAGTSDLPVAEEAAVVAELFGNKVERLVDVGIAGLPRLLAAVDLLRSAAVLIVVAGMEGALPSAVAGLVERPVIAVPTSVGYGASFGGVAALLGMLNSCAANVAVVNIDNGFGAAVLASMINRG